MPELPKISGKQAILVFESLGFKVVRQKGSHIVLRKENLGCVIPDHKELAIGTLKSALRQAKVTTEEFVQAYQAR